VRREIDAAWWDSLRWLRDGRRRAVPVLPSLHTTSTFRPRRRFPLPTTSHRSRSSEAQGPSPGECPLARHLASYVRTKLACLRELTLRHSGDMMQVHRERGLGAAGKPNAPEKIRPDASFCIPPFANPTLSPRHSLQGSASCRASCLPWARAPSALRPLRTDGSARTADALLLGEQGRNDDNERCPLASPSLDGALSERSGVP